MDNNLVITVKAVGIPEAQAQMTELGATIEKMTVNANGTVSASGRLASTLNEQTNATERVARTTDRAASSQENYFVHIAKTTVQSALVNKAFLGLVGAADKAVKQVDLLANFPAAMQSLGLSGKDASDALIKLRGYVAGVGGDLTAATTSVTRFTEVTKNVKAATIEFAGVNNALIAGAAPAEIQKNALEQLTQAYSRGKPQLIEWRSLMVAMPAQLTAVAQAMKLPNAQALGESLTKGKTSMQDFMTKLTELSTGTGPIAAQARIRMTGIQFASNQMSAALTNGLTAIFQAVGRENIVAFLRFLTEVIGVVSRGVVILINDLISLFNIISNVFNGPQIAHFSGDSQKAADALGAGAANANDLGNGLGTAADNAAKINKSLASFDKMNVLPDKTSGKTKNPADGTTGPLDAATAKKLEDLFNGMGGALKAASEAAKIFAGIISALAANALISKLFGVNPLKELIKGIGDATKGFTGLGGEAEKAGEKTGKSFATKFGEATAKGFSASGSAISGAIGGLAGTVAGFFANTVGPAVAAAFSDTIIPAIALAGNAILDAFLVFAGGVAVVLSVPLDVAIAIIAVAVAIIVGIIWLIWTNWQTIWGFIKAVFDAVWGAIVATWNTLFAIFAAPIEWILGFIRGVVILIVALFLWLVLGIAKLWWDMVTGIFNLLVTVGGWINDNVIQPVWQGFQWLWNTVTGAIVAAWQWIYANVLAPIWGWININVISPITNIFSGLWRSVSGFFGNLFNDIKNILSPLGSWISANIIGPIAGFFKGLWDGVKNGVGDMISGVKNILGSLGDIVKSPINLVIDGWNKIIGSINKIHIPGTNVGPNFQPLPRLALGGVVNQPTIATIGESGAEVVMPLQNNTGWIDVLASKINEKSGGGQPIQLVVQIGEDKVATKVIDLINEKTSMSGRNVIYV